jgi:UDP:flavonoid glycosyltransferase YjiC (YdhE family)
MLGTGFTVPPAEAAELPQLLPGTLPHTPQAQLLKVVETVQQRAHRPLPATLPGIFAAAARFVCTFPELDPYQAIRAQPALGPLNPLPPLREPSGPPALFVYLSADFGGVSQVLELLAKMRIPTTAFIRGAAPALVDRFTKLGIQMYATPAPIHEVLPRAAAILHHGGLLTTEEALAAGRPQVLLPRYLEQELNALAIQRMGVGTALGGQVQLQAVSQAVHQVLADPRFARQAMQWGRTVQERGPYQPLAQIVEHCQAILVS